MFKQIICTYKQTGFLHHGYLIVGKQETIQKMLLETLKTFGNETNTIWENYETFGINESRTLAERSSRHNWNGQREFVVLKAQRYTLEAQNALLKLFEEPRPRLHFFLIGMEVTEFLPTLRSRLMVVENQKGDELINEIEKKKASQFLSATPVDRLNLIAEELKKELSREEWLPFLNVLEVASHKKQPLNERALTEIISVRRYLTDPASLPRLLFEHLALVLPKYDRMKI